MQKGLIVKLLDYYLGQPKFKHEMERAMHEFFDVPGGQQLATVDEVAAPYFNEWLVYDFRLTNGKSLIDDFYERNPYNKPLYEMQEYHDLRDNIYGLLEAQKVYRGEGMDVLVLHTGEKYFVREHSATFELKNRDLFFGRIGRIGDHWELVGSNSFSLGMSIDKAIKKALLDPAKKMTPKDALIWYNRTMLNIDEKEAAYEESLTDDVDEIMERIDQLLRSCDIDMMVNAERIKSWINNLDFKKTHAVYAISPMLYGLMNEGQGKHFEDLMAEIIHLANNTEHFALKGKSPKDIRGEDPDRPTHFDSRITQFGGYKSWKMMEKATSAMQLMDYDLAIDAFEKGFEKMKKEHTTYREIYRIYTNLAICFFTFGEVVQGNECLKIALELNPNYDFGILTKKRLDSGEFDERMASYVRYFLDRSRKRKGWEFELKNKAEKMSASELLQTYFKINKDDEFSRWTLSPAKEYYEFLKQFQINFKTDNLTSSVIR